MRFVDDDKENTFQQPSTSAEIISQTRRPALGERQINNEKLSSSASTTSVSGEITSLSFANMRLEHTPRFSVACLVHMCQLHMSSPNTVPVNDVLELVTLITDEAFVEFTLEMIEKKLASLDGADARLDYDPESLNSVDLAECLLNLWLCFIQRICGSNELAPHFTCYRPFFASSSTHSDVFFFERTYRYARLSQLIWRHFASTGGMETERSCDRLVHDERAHYARENRCPFSFSSRKSLTPQQCDVLHEKSKAVVYWKLVANLVRTVKLHLPPTNKTPPANQALDEAAKIKRDNERLCAAKICNELLQLVSLVLTSRRHPVDILSLVEPRRKHELIQWLYDLASHEFVSTPTSAAIGLGCTIYKLISCLTAQSTTNAHLMKDLALDIYNCRSANQAKGTFSKQLLIGIVSKCIDNSFLCFFELSSQLDRSRAAHSASSARDALAVPVRQPIVAD